MLAVGPLVLAPVATLPPDAQAMRSVVAVGFGVVGIVQAW